MKYIAEINIMPHKELLDPQGKTVVNNLRQLEIEGVADMRIGKHITMKFEAADEQAAKEKVEMACQKILANVIIETYSYQISPDPT